MAKPYRKFFFTCYPESCNISSAIISCGCDKFAYILHDSDTDENGNIKKTHYHVYIEYKHARQIAPIADKFGVSTNMIEYCHSTRGAIRYLIHMNDKDKYQYGKELVVSNGLDCFDYWDAVTESDKVSMILDTIETLAVDSESTIVHLVRAVCDQGLYPEFRRGQATFLAIWKSMH